MRFSHTLTSRMHRLLLLLLLLLHLRLNLRLIHPLLVLHKSTNCLYVFLSPISARSKMDAMQVFAAVQSDISPANHKLLAAATLLQVEPARLRCCFT